MWNTDGAVRIHTPSGDYTIKSDDLKKELVEAAKFAGLGNFNVKIDGHYVEKEDQLQTNSVTAVNAPISVERYDTAG